MNAEILKNWKFLFIIGAGFVLYALWIYSEGRR